MKKIALVGQPNVGKSSLFNRLLKKRVAIISEVSGTTRDIKKIEVNINDKKALLFDTGGIEDKDDKIFSKVREKSILTAKEADIVLFIVDGKKLPDEKDKKLFYEIDKLNKKIILVINKIDNDKLLENVWNYYEFGVEDIFPISVAHNRGIGKLLDYLSALLDDNIQNIDDMSLEDFIEDYEIVESKNENIVDDEINIAIIGRVNVGKSSIMNALLGEERSIVSDVAGTTIDPVDESFEYKGKKITFIDTAGIRRRGKIEGIEKYAFFRTNEMLEKANLALLVLDASTKIKELDEKVAGNIDKYGLATIIVVNKWDDKKYDYDEVVKEIRYRFKFLYYAPIIVVSAKTKRNIEKLKEKIIEVYNNYTKRIPTSKLNEIVQKAINKHALPAPNGNRLKIYYATQYKVAPPTIALIMNKPKLLHFSYKRYLINTFREYLDFTGVPLHIVARGKNDNNLDE